MRHDTYIPKAYEVKFLKFKKKHGKHTSRELCYLMGETIDG